MNLKSEEGHSLTIQATLVRQSMSNSDSVLRFEEQLRERELRRMDLPLTVPRIHLIHVLETVSRRR